MATKRKSNTLPVIAYPEGEKVGKVVSGKFGGTKPRHVAYGMTTGGQWVRLGTFDTWTAARDIVLKDYRGEPK